MCRPQDYDVAILTLSTPAPTSASNIDRICLPSVSIDYNQYQAVVAGWGSTKAIGFSQPDELKKVVVQIWDNPRCARSYGSDAPGGITARMMCANLPGKDSCQVSSTANSLRLTHLIAFQRHLDQFS